MEYLEGVKLSDSQGLAAICCDREELARRGVDLYLETIFSDGFFHADPHPGNLVVLPGNRIGLLDFGMMGRVDEPLREAIEDLLLAVVQQDCEALAAIIHRIGSLPGKLDEAALRSDLADYVAHFGNQPMDRFNLSAALEEMIDLIYRYHIVLPAQVGMILKVFITLEGTSRLLSPSFSLLQVIRRYQRKAILRRLSPRRRLRKFRRVMSEFEQLVEVLPRRMMDLLSQMQAGKFDVHLDHRGLEPSVNRLVLGLLASALFMGSALLLSQQVPPLLFPRPSYLGMHNVSILGLGGCIVSLLLGLRLLRAIGKSGHLDRRQ
jgi:ubiquinone biosynthesis protein